MSEKPIHIPVLLSETIESLDIKPDGIYVDCTTGFAGHSSEIAKRLTTGRLIGFDRDPDAVKAAEEKLKDYPHTLINRKFSTFDESLDEIGVGKVDGVLMDLGVSSYQLDTAERGFSYHEDAPLDMRMSKSGLSAYDVVNEYSKEQLEKILFEYGEEKFAHGIVSGILKARETAPIKTTLELAEIVKRNVPLKVRKEKNPCKKTFQAIRIEVNGELDELKKGMSEAFERLSAGGRLAIITFHSIEDRLYLSAGFSCLRMRKEAERQNGLQKAGNRKRRGTCGEQPIKKCKTQSNRETLIKGNNNDNTAQQNKYGL